MAEIYEMINYDYTTGIIEMGLINDEIIYTALGKSPKNFKEGGIVNLFA